MTPSSAPLARSALALAAALAGVILIPRLGQTQEVGSASARPPQVREWILHFDGSMSDVTAPAHASFLQHVAATTDVCIAVPSARDETLFRNLMDLPSGHWDHISFLVTGHAITAWARDRYLILQRHGRPTIVVPDPGPVRGDKRGDLGVATRLADGAPPGRILRSRLVLEGGDVLIGSQLALVGAWTVDENRRHLECDGDDVRAALGHVLGRRVVVVGAGLAALPHEHIDMVVHLVDDRTVIVGDPRAAAGAWEELERSASQRGRLAAYGRPSQRNQLAWADAYDTIADGLRDAGFRVERVPAVHADDDDLVLTWTNAVVDHRLGKAHAYVPTYGLALLDAAAHGVWKRLGYEVHAVDTSTCIRAGGAIRCLTNALAQEGARPPARARAAHVPLPPGEAEPRPPAASTTTPVGASRGGTPFAKARASRP